MLFTPATRVINRVPLVHVDKGLLSFQGLLYNECVCCIMWPCLQVRSYAESIMGFMAVYIQSVVVHHSVVVEVVNHYKYREENLVTGVKLSDLPRSRRQIFA